MAIRSKTGVGAQVGRPRMTWLMVRDVFLGLQEVLERRERGFETSFVVVDEEGRSLGHGEVGEGTGREAGEVE